MLNNTMLASFRDRVAVPTYARSDLRTAIVHLGVGGFHRAHQALYLDDLAQRGITMDWGERGVGLLDSDRRMAEALVPQDCLYTVVERDAYADSARIVGSVLGYAFAPANPSAVLDVLIDPTTRIVTLTITEGGYLVDDTTGEFDADNAAVRADTNPDAPRTAFGYLASALNIRREKRIPPARAGHAR
jgi:mannitol 2-dehydrogenase